jgi:hypothetical protein
MASPSSPPSFQTGVQQCYPAAAPAGFGVSRDAIIEVIHIMDISQKFGPTSFAVIERRLARQEFIAPADLALAIEANRDVALPAAIRDYLLRTLRGKVKARRGRKSLGAVREIRDLFLLPLYDRYLGWLRRRRKRFGLKGWAPINNAEWWQGSPSERAARMVAQHLRVVFPNHSWQHVRNEVSALRRRRKRCS